MVKLCIKQRKCCSQWSIRLRWFDGPGTDTKWSFKKNDQYWDKDTVKLDSVDVNVVKRITNRVELVPRWTNRRCRSFW